LPLQRQPDYNSKRIFVNATRPSNGSKLIAAYSPSVSKKRGRKGSVYRGCEKKKK
jgi:hypothetical protein